MPLQRAIDDSFADATGGFEFAPSAAHLDAFMTDHWLSSELNVIVLYLRETAYQDTTHRPL